MLVTRGVRRSFKKSSEKLPSGDNVIVVVAMWATVIAVVTILSTAHCQTINGETTVVFISLRGPSTANISVWGYSQRDASPCIGVTSKAFVWVAVRERASDLHNGNVVQLGGDANSKSAQPSVEVICEWRV
jgi:hypothetical protein